MDRLDQKLFDAWHRIAAGVRCDRLDGLRRAARRHRSITRYTMRPWYLCLRACDTRLPAHATVIELLPDDDRDLDVPVHELIDRGRRHLITLHGAGIRELLKPVDIQWPGDRHHRVAKMLGISARTLHRWIKVGAVRTDSTVGPIPNIRGKPGRHVYADRPLDPNGFLGRPPDEMWGSLWQTNHEKIPDAYELLVERRPRTRLWRGEEKLRGWDFICPGRYERCDDGGTSEDGEASRFRLIPCGRRARRLFFPLPVWTIPQAMNDRMQLDGGWSPGFDDPLAGSRSFACKHCWRVRSITLTDANGWNEYITHVTGGLLYGHEVERPTEIVPFRRKHRFTPRPRQESIELRERIVPLLLDGLTYKQIAEQLGVTHGSIMHHVHTIYRVMGVSSREQLREQVEMDERHAAMQHSAAHEYEGQ